MRRQGGVRDRLGLKRSPEESPADSSTGDSSGERGDPHRMRGGVRRRVVATQEQEAGASSSDGASPVTQSLKRQWVAGQLTSPQVQDLALNAGLQGARGLEALGSAGA